jgi:acyl carrier protein
MSTEAKLRIFIMENYMFTEDQSALKNSDSFLDMGIIDSTGIMEVILFIEEEFDIEIDDEEMIPENLDSIDNIVAFLAKKTA